MLIRFVDDYDAAIVAGKALVGDIQFRICTKEKFMGASKYLDVLYAQSVIISAIIDQLENEDNAVPRANEALLMTLKSVIDKDICNKPRNSVVNLTNYHQ